MNDTNFNQLLQTIIYVLIVFVIPAVGYFLSNYLHQTGGSVSDQRKRAFAELLVKAAEQTLDNNPEKRMFVEHRLVAMFPTITQEEADALIEAAVLSLHSALGIYQSPVPADHAPAPPIITGVVGPDDHPAGEPPTLPDPPPSQPNPRV